jgi:hypothetical protein
MRAGNPQKAPPHLLGVPTAYDQRGKRSLLEGRVAGAWPTIERRSLRGAPFGALLEALTALLCGLAAFETATSRKFRRELRAR